MGEEFSDVIGRGCQAASAWSFASLALCPYLKPGHKGEAQEAVELFTFRPIPGNYQADLMPACLQSADSRKKARVILDRIQPTHRADNKLVIADAPLPPQCEVAPGAETIGIYSVRDEHQFLLRNSNCLLKPEVKILRDCNEPFGSECHSPASKIPAPVLAGGIRHVAAVFTMYDCGSEHRTCRQHSIKGGPVSRMDYVEIAALEKFAQTKNKSNIIAWLFMQFVVDDRTSEPLEKLSAGMQET